MKFHSPYQFINIRETNQADNARVEFSVSDNHQKYINSKFVRHDYWHKSALSGIINCSFTTLTPLVVGAKHDEANKTKHAGRVHPYQHPDGTLAIPANSLRGMISSLLENISQSSLRVLNQRTKTQYSMRESVHNPLKKMGLLLKDEDANFVLYELGEAQSGVPKNNKDKLSSYQHLRDEGKLSQWRGATGVHYIRGDLFFNKKHETFIEWDGTLSGTGIPVNQQVELFQQTLQTYAKNLGDLKKALPIGYPLEKNKETGIQEPIVKEGDLVYYRKENDGTISELSYSQIWRKHIKWDLYEAVEKAGGKDALPWSSERTHLTPAEAIFGTVEEEQNKERSTQKLSRNLASRVRFSDAKPSQKITLLNGMILKILDSPKPPSPCMYFQSPDGKHISKDDLATKLYKPNGRKHYLPNSEKNGENWQSQYSEDKPPVRDNKINWSQYLHVTPIPEKQTFTFKINFENLSQPELDLLLTSIEPAAESTQFVHKLGLGKPLGLGDIQLKTENVEIITRNKCYTASQLKQTNSEIYTIPSLNARIANEQSLIDSETLKDLQTLYNPDNIQYPVCYPFDSLKGQAAYNEEKGYEWFTTNEKKANRTEQLTPVKAGQTIPTLDSFG